MHSETQKLSIVSGLPIASATSTALLITSWLPILEPLIINGFLAFLSISAVLMTSGSSLFSPFKALATARPKVAISWGAREMELLEISSNRVSIADTIIRGDKLS